MPQRFEIHDHGAEVSPLYHFSAGGRRGAKLTIPLEVVPFYENVANPSDLKHVVELLGRSGGLGVVITTRTHLWDAV